MTHAQIILMLAPFVTALIVVASVATIIAVQNWRIHRLMHRRVSELFPG